MLILASDDTQLQLIQVAIAGGFVGVGAAVGVATVDKDTQALIGADSTIDGKGNGAGIGGVRNGQYMGKGFGTIADFHGVALQASSSEDIFGLTASIGGGFVGVAGAVDVGVLDVTVQAAVGTGSSVRANDDIQVNALSRKDVQTYALSVGGGFVGVAGSVSVWSVGTQSTTTYEDGADGPDKGAWTSGTAYNKADVVTFGGSKYSAKIDNPNTSSDPAANNAEWMRIEKTKPLDSTQTNPVNDSDAIASGGDNSCTDSDCADSGPGYKSSLEGASTRDAGPWTSGMEYRQGDVVTFSGSRFIARQTITDTSSTPNVNTSEWNSYSSSAAADITNS